MWSDQLARHWCHHEDNKISRNNICSSLYKYSPNLTFISGRQYCISCCVGAQWQTGRSDAAFVQLRPENVLRQPTVGALCGCVVFGNQSGHSFLKCLVIQPAVYIFIYLITHVTSWQRIPPATCGEVSSSCVQSDEKKRLIPSKYRAMSHMIHPLSLLSHNLSHCVTGHPTMTQHIQLYCLQALHNDPVSSRTDGPKIRLLIGDIHWFYSILRRWRNREFVKIHWSDVRLSRVCAGNMKPIAEFNQLSSNSGNTFRSVTMSSRCAGRLICLSWDKDKVAVFSLYS